MLKLSGVRGNRDRPVRTQILPHRPHRLAAMNGGRYQIEYGPSALGDLDRMPARERAQVLRKIERPQNGLHGDIKRLQQHEMMYRLRASAWATIGCCLMW